jgi:hypothetical protein
MNLEKDKIMEERLRACRPVQPRASLQKGIEHSLGNLERRKRITRWRVISGWGALAAAAAALVIFGLMLFNGRLGMGQNQPVEETVSEPPLVVGETPEESPDAFKPVLAENNLTGRVDEGIVFLKNGLTARRYRYEFIDRVVWKNPSDGAVVEMEIPRDEYVLIPVQTF